MKPLLLPFSTYSNPSRPTPKRRSTRGMFGAQGLLIDEFYGPSGTNAQQHLRALRKCNFASPDIVRSDDADWSALWLSQLNSFRLSKLVSNRILPAASHCFCRLVTALLMLQEVTCFFSRFKVSFRTDSRKPSSFFASPPYARLPSSRPRKAI